MFQWGRGQLAAEILFSGSLRRPNLSREQRTGIASKAATSSMLRCGREANRVSKARQRLSALSNSPPGQAALDHRQTRVGPANCQLDELHSRAKHNTVQLGKTGTDTNFLLLEIGCLSQRFAALTEQCWS